MCRLGANVKAVRARRESHGGEEARAAVNFSRPALALRVLVGLLPAFVAVGLVDFALLRLNAQHVVLPQFDIPRLIPYHDPRFTKRDALLRQYRTPPRISFSPATPGPRTGSTLR